MANVVYLQCDIRYNEWLLKEIDGISVIERTINRIKKINSDSVIAGIFKCDENKELVQILEKNDVCVYLSNQENVNVRFADIIRNRSEHFVIRTGGDQVLIDSDYINEIISEMEEQDFEWFFEPTVFNSVFPDIVSIECIRKNYEEIVREDRYFAALNKKSNIKRYEKRLPGVCFEFRANSNEGYRICRKVIENKLDIYLLSKKLLSAIGSKRSYLRNTGLLGSWILDMGEVEDFFYDEQGEVNPWWVETVADLVREKVNKNMKVFEWGCGNSTLFWARHVDYVVSVEHNLQWYEKMKKHIPENVKLVYSELKYGEDYCKKVLEEEAKFDIILIDGRDRVNCVKNAVERLTDDGVIVWDNTDRAYYQEGYDLLKSKGFRRLELSGILYQSPWVEDFTSIFYRENNVLGL